MRCKVPDESGVEFHSFEAGVKGEDSPLVLGAGKKAHAVCPSVYAITSGFAHSRPCTAWPAVFKQ